MPDWIMQLEENEGGKKQKRNSEAKKKDGVASLPWHLLLRKVEGGRITIVIWACRLKGTSGGKTSTTRK